MLFTFVLISVFALVAMASVIMAVRVLGKNKYYEKRFSGIIDVEKEVEIGLKHKINVENDIEKLKKVYQSDVDKLKKQYDTKKNKYDSLVKQVAIFDEQIELAEMGFYKPHYDFDTSEKYKFLIERTRDKQKEMLSTKTAVICLTQWTVDGSVSKGTASTNRLIRLTIRAYNNECDAAIGKITWKNAETIEVRIERAFDAINKLNKSQNLHITVEYHELIH